MNDIWPSSEQDAIEKMEELTERENIAIAEGKN